MAELLNERRGEISYAILMELIKKEGVKSLQLNDLLRKIGSAIELEELKKIGVTKKEALQFAHKIYLESLTAFVTGLRIEAEKEE